MLKRQPPEHQSCSLHPNPTTLFILGLKTYICGGGGGGEAGRKFRSQKYIYYTNRGAHIYLVPGGNTPCSATLSLCVCVCVCVSVCMCVLSLHLWNTFHCRCFVYQPPMTRLNDVKQYLWRNTITSEFAMASKRNVNDRDNIHGNVCV